ncbi:MAG: MBG domain-containing protein, partial [Alphaproteobacteria bacterium]
SGDTISGSLSRVAGENVGNYLIDANVLSAGSNYTVTYVDGNLQITPKALTITADSFSKTYGAADPTLTYSTSGLVSGDTISGSLSRVAGENVGNYLIDADTLSAGSNYTVTYVDGNLQITPKGLTITANDQTKTYGQTFTFNGTEFSTSGLVSGDSVDSADLSSSGAPAGAWAGDYSIDLGKVSGTGLSNYDITYVNGNMHVDKANLTITANDQTKPYGSTFQFYGDEYSASGLVNGDQLGLMNLFSEGAPSGAQPGQYYISINFPQSNQNSLLAAIAVLPPAAVLANYNITFVGGTLTIPTVQPVAPTFRIDPLGRPIISVANQAIVLDAPFEQIETLTLNTDVAINYNPGSSSGTSAADLANIAPAAGGEDTSAEGLANIEPAAGGESGGAAGGSDVACANDFLSNRPCQLPE